MRRSRCNVVDFTTISSSIFARHASIFIYFRPRGTLEIDALNTVHNNGETLQHTLPCLAARLLLPPAAFFAIVRAFTRSRSSCFDRSRFWVPLLAPSMPATSLQFYLRRNTTPAEFSLRDMVEKFEEKLLPMTMNKCSYFYSLLYQPIKSGDNIEFFCMNARKIFNLLTRRAKFPGPGEPALCVFLYQQLLPFILGDFSMDFREYQDEMLNGDLLAMTLESFIKSVHEITMREGRSGRSQGKFRRETHRYFGSQCEDRRRSLGSCK
jgi:hypothetical protein